MSWTDWAQLAVQAFGAYSSSKAQSDAAKAAGNQAAAGSQASNDLLREFYNRDEARNQPFYQAGVSGLNQYMAMLGLGGVQAGATGGTQGGFQNWVQEDANGVPIPNAQLYQSDPQYRQAWDAALQTHQGQWNGNGYWHGSDNEWIRSQIGQRYTPPAPATPAQQAQNTQNTQQAAYAQFRNQPGYQFGLDEGIRSIDASSAAAGSRNSGKTLKALMQYGQNYADQQGYTPYMNRLASLAGIGQTTSNQMGQAGQQYGGQMGQNMQNAANARAQSTYNAGNARAWGIQQMGNFANDWYGSYRQGQQMSGGSGGGTLGNWGDY